MTQETPSFPPHPTAVLVTGASGGLGRAACAALASPGVTVVGWGRDGDALAQTGAAVAAAGGTFVAQTVDLTDRDALARAADDALARHQVSVLVNITGGPAPGPVVGIDAAVWETAFASLVLPVLALTARLLPPMQARGWGRVITCTSSGVIAPIPGLGVSNTLRACLLGWSKTVAEEVARDGVTSNIVVPGRIATARVAQLDRARAQAGAVDVDDVRRASAASIPLGRYGRPEEFGSAVAFLAGTGSSYVTGSVLRVDGGLIRSV